MYGYWKKLVINIYFYCSQYANTFALFFLGKKNYHSNFPPKQLIFYLVNYITSYLHKVLRILIICMALDSQRNHIIQLDIQQEVASSHLALIMGFENFCLKLYKERKLYKHTNFNKAIINKYKFAFLKFT